MAINNDRNLVEQQILSISRLKGKELENLKARLTTLSEQELQAELSKALAGDNKGEWYTGLQVEHVDSEVMLDNHDKSTFTDEQGNEITEYKDGEDVIERAIKSTDESGNVYETIVTFAGGKPLSQTKTKNGNTTETTKYEYNNDGSNEYVTVKTEKSNKTTVTTNVLEIDENGNFEKEDFIDRQTVSIDGTVTDVYIEDGYIVEEQTKPLAL